MIDVVIMRNSGQLRNVLSKYENDYAVVIGGSDAVADSIGIACS